MNNSSGILRIVDENCNAIVNGDEDWMRKYLNLVSHWGLLDGVFFKF